MPHSSISFGMIYIALHAMYYILNTLVSHVFIRCRLITGVFSIKPSEIVLRFSC